MPQQLHDLEVDWVSLVDRAAVRDSENPDQPMRLLLWKREHNEPPQEGRMTPEETTAALEKAQEDLKKAQDEAKANAERAEKAEKDAADLTARVEKLEKADGGEPEPEAVNKDDLPEPVRKALEKAEADAKADRERAEKAEKAANEAAEIAKAERDERLTRDFVAKAEGYKALAVKAEDFGPVLKSAAEKLTKDEYEALETVLKAADGALQETDLFKEQGRSREGAPTDALTEAQQKAAEIKKSDHTLTDAQALDKALSADRDLQARYLAEVR